MPATVTLALEALPLLLLIGLLARGCTPPAAGVAALLAALPAIALALPAGVGMPGFLLRASLEGAWLAAQPIAVVSAGLLFHGAVARPEPTRPEPTRPEPTRPEPARPEEAGRPHGADRAMLFSVAFLAGPFLESVTGFGVGVVFALGTLRRAGLSGPAAVAVGLFALLLVPWGGLGPGTVLGAALAGVDVQAMGSINAWLTAAWLFMMLLLFWRLSDALALPGRAAVRLAEAGWVGALGALLIGAHRVLPVELCGVAATGVLLLLRQRDQLAEPASRRAAVPYLVLTAGLMGSRLLPGIGPWLGAHALRPLPGLPGFALNHVSLVLVLVAAVLLGRRPAPLGIVRAALARARRPALAMLLFVVFARWLSGAGIAASLAGGLAQAAGPLAPFAAPVLASAAGFFIGTNVGSNSATMPLVAALSAGTALPPVLLPAIQNFCGSAAVLLAPPVIALATGVAGEAIPTGAIWRRIWLLVPASIAVAWGAILLAGPLAQWGLPAPP